MVVQLKPRQSIEKYLSTLPEEVQKHFEHLGQLGRDYPLEVALAYAFHRLEVGQRMCLYAGLVNVIRCNPKMAKDAVDDLHMTRDEFLRMYNLIFGSKVTVQAQKKMKEAVKTRDVIMHGGSTEKTALREAVGAVLYYAQAVNEQLAKKHAMKPFRGDLRGFTRKGGKARLDEQTTRFVLKGMGFNIS